MSEQHLYLIGTHSYRLLPNPYDKHWEPVCQHPYREVTDFPDAWEPIPGEWNQTLDSFPVGEYCLTSQGTYRRRYTLQLTGQTR